MATVGMLGNSDVNIVFGVSRKQVLTFDGMKWSRSAKYSTINRHLQKPLLEFTGMDPDSISFSIVVSVFLGTNPFTEIRKIMNAVANGETMRLVIGHKVYGAYRWVITKNDVDMERYDNKGNLLHAKLSISLQSYESR